MLGKSGRLTGRAFGLLILVIVAGFGCGSEPDPKQAPIKQGDKVEVVNGPAPVKLGDETLTTLDTGTLITAGQVRGKWVAVIAKKGDATIDGWVNGEKHLRLAKAGAATAAVAQDQPGTTVARTVAGAGLRLDGLYCYNAEPVNISGLPLIGYLRFYDDGRFVQAEGMFGAYGAQEAQHVGNWIRFDKGKAMRGVSCGRYVMKGSMIEATFEGEKANRIEATLVDGKLKWNGATAVRGDYRCSFWPVDFVLDVEPRLTKERINKPDKQGITPLMAAAIAMQAGTVDVLLENGADAKATVKGGYTVLHMLCESSHGYMSEPFGKIVDALIKHGADVNAKSDDGKVPLDVAHTLSDGEMAKFMRARGAKWR